MEEYALYLSVIQMNNDNGMPGWRRVKVVIFVLQKRLVSACGLNKIVSWAGKICPTGWFYPSREAELSVSRDKIIRLTLFYSHSFWAIIFNIVLALSFIIS